MIKKLHLLVIKSYIGPLILTFFIAEFVLIMHFLWLYISDLVGKGLEWSVVAELLLYASAGLVKMALPLAILLASIMTFGNFGENFELSAMKSAGISLQRIMMPLIIFSVAISIGSFYFSNYVIPYTNLKTGALLYDVGNQRPELNIKPGIFNNDLEGFNIKIKSKNPDNNMMYDFMVYDHSERRGNPKVTLSDSGTMEVTGDQKYMIITMYGGRTFEELNEKKPAEKIYPEQHTYFDKQTFIRELTGFDLERTDEDLFKHHYQMKRIDELEKSSDSLSETLENRRAQFVNGLNRTKYFKYERKKSNIKDTSLFEADSVKIITPPEELKIEVNIDSVLNTATLLDKDKTIRMAIENASTTKKYIDSNEKDMYERAKDIHKHDIAWHEKFTLSFACLIFFFIGAPLGAIIRKGGFGLPFLVSIIFFLLYYVVSLMGRKFVEEGVLLPWEGMWLSSLLTLPLGILFTYKATTDSVLFDIGAYFEFLKRPFRVLDISYKDPSVVFHKDVEVPEIGKIKMSVSNLKNQAFTLKKQVIKEYKSRDNLYMRHFSNDVSDLRLFIENYNLLYDILSVKFRDKKFLKASLEKFPKIEFVKYEMTKKKLWANYFLLTIGIFPLGLLTLLRSYLKLNVLKQKIELVEENLKTFEHQIVITKDEPISNLTTKQEKNELIKEIPNLVSKPNIVASESISDEEIINSINHFNSRLQEKSAFMSFHLSSLFDFLRLLFTKELFPNQEFFKEFIKVRQLIRAKYSESTKINEHLFGLTSFNLDRYKMNHLKISFNYFLLAFVIPLGLFVFIFSFYKLKRLKNYLEKAQDEFSAIAGLISSSRYNDQEQFDLSAEETILSKGIDQITETELRELLDKLNKYSVYYLNNIMASRISVFEFLRLLLTKEINSIENYVDFYGKVYIIVNGKFRNSEVLSANLANMPKSKDLNIRMTNLKIFSNYIFLTFFPVGIFFFLQSYFKFKAVENKIRNVHQTTDKLLTHL